MINQWNGFNEGNWTNEIDVRDFIQKNFTLYEGDASFLAGPTENTKKVWEKAGQLIVEEIKQGVRKRLIPALKDANMLLPESIYKEFDVDNGKPILQMSEFNGLIALSQKYKVPVFALNDDQLEQRGIVAERTKKSMQRFHQLFSDGADKIINLVTAANAAGT